MGTFGLGHVRIWHILHRAQKSFFLVPLGVERDSDTLMIQNFVVLCVACRLV